MNYNDFFQSKLFKGFLFGLIILIVFLVGFKAGTLVGFRKADFSIKWGDNYHRNFAGPAGGFMENLKDKEFLEASGILGQIIKTDNDSLIIRGKDDVEKKVIIDDKTVIKFFQENIGFSDLKIDDLLVVIGEPNDNGQIVAKLIRVMPPAPAQENLHGTSTSTPQLPIPNR